MTADIAAAYDARAVEYVDLLGSVEQMAPQDRRTITKWTQSLQGSILDAGCGPGHWTHHLAKGGERHVVGVEASATFVSSARVRFPHTAFALGDLADLPFASGSVGGVLAWYSLIHTPPRELPALCAEIARVLRPDGSLLLGYFEGPAGAPFAHAVTTAHTWDAATLGEMLAPHGFAVEEAVVRQDPGARRHGHLVARRRS